MNYCKGAFQMMLLWLALMLILGLLIYWSRSVWDMLVTLGG